ncbi:MULTISPECIES: mechanosensitive ion channel family protein [Streptomyces]|uniref:mechanosensitive ion channel family protein n=1 Tax=Streptomyces TaxID=1883 RepID=UPI001291ECAD|nr:MULTISPECIES: mechanosensitive ion channel family protein [Streptomyces]MCX5040977.1 mechanosensitive ion channel family protein [Streptomyces coelicoflavus]QFX79970.1 mechanosensitive ion channel [Streptomyces sp. SYP-A7193]
MSHPLPPAEPATTPQLAASWSDWIGDHTTSLIGIPLRIALIVVILLVLRMVAKRAITRVVQRVLEPSAGEAERSRPRRQARGAAVLHRDRSRARQRREQRARTIGSVLSSAVTIVLFMVGVAMVLDQVGIALGPLLASAGVVGLAIGFGAQSLVADYLSGLLIMVEDQYGVGDSVDLGEAVGEVEHVGLRLTHVRDLNGGLWHIRNGEILRVRNDSQEWARAVLDVAVSHDANLDTVYRVLEDAGRALREEPDFADALLEDPAVWGVQSLDADGMLVRLAVKTVPLQQWGVTRELRRRVKEALDEAGVEIPFPRRTVWLRTEDPEDEKQVLTR